MKPTAKSFLRDWGGGEGEENAKKSLKKVRWKQLGKSKLLLLVSLKLP